VFIEDSYWKIGIYVLMQVVYVILLTRLPPAFYIIKLTNEPIKYLLTLFVRIARTIEITLVLLKSKGKDN